ncbi:hypothetical protein F3Y22_tig00110387pilonHSYRG00316 [Hibiscus syriacus]|uniref:Uncharacterized protein n=1 Tax=Hibiscus syriacus TaxID=106335 RepID=A0A6A3AU62_HIBSY|nr:hypothetical protein F3Y22_tig00110387pilonHSYRG00316 [Hibiscus syriacus]
MAALTEFFSHLYTMTVVFFNSYSSKLQPSSGPSPTAFPTPKSVPSPPPSTSNSLKKRTQQSFTPQDRRRLRRGWTSHRMNVPCVCPSLKKVKKTKVLPDEIVANYHRLQNQVEYDGSDEDVVFLLSALHDNSLHRWF